MPVVAQGFNAGNEGMPVAVRALHQPTPGLMLADSYHCSRQNTNTGRLTPAMFAAVFDRLREALVSA